MKTKTINLKFYNAAEKKPNKTGDYCVCSVTNDGIIYCVAKISYSKKHDLFNFQDWYSDEKAEKERQEPYGNDNELFWAKFDKRAFVDEEIKDNSEK